MPYNSGMESSSEFLRYLAYVYDHAYDMLRVRKAIVDPQNDSLTVEFVLSYEDYDKVTAEDREKIDAAVKLMFARLLDSQDSLSQKSTLRRGGRSSRPPLYRRKQQGFADHFEQG